jgi:hypothetical protein
MVQTTINGLFTEQKQAWLEEARYTARKLLETRESVTIEDVLKECPRPSYLHRNVCGSVFDSDFKSVGFTKSKRPVSKGRWIQQWVLVREPVPRKHKVGEYAS